MERSSYERSTQIPNNQFSYFPKREGRNRSIPSANVLIYKLANGETVIVRPSGTEPKIKVYYTTLGKDLAEAEAEKEKLAEALKPILA